uniref:hypothetical protein n=1 Tax=Staphylococcus aureus TaxID=1280 RepID=UPI00159522DA|nr:hypothetical protein [Staphylococcus aureus]
MLSKKEKKKLQDLVSNNSKFHYMLTDRVRQDVKYYIVQCKSLEKAKEGFEKLSYLLSLFETNERPEWYTLSDLENDKKMIELLENGQHIIKKRKGVLM